MKLDTITIFTKEGLKEINRKEWAKMFDELMGGDKIEIVEIHY